MNSKPKVAVFGSGSWATAIVKMLSENLETVGWYFRNEQSLEYIKQNRHNPKYLTAVEFDTNQLMLSKNINELIDYADYLVFVIPSAFVYQELKKIETTLDGKIFFSAIKGIIPESGLIVGEHFHEVLKVPFENIGVITGPCHAEEVALERLSYLTIASQDKNKAFILGSCLAGDYIKTKTSDDIIGTEYAAMLKNIYAIAAGIAHGLGYGDNFQSVLMSNSIREMKRFIKKVHKMKRNINNSAYLGDLLVTGYSVFSRNRMFGNMIGKGYSVEAAQLEMVMVAEGYYATNSAYNINQKNGARTPIIDTVYSVLYEKKNAKIAFKELTSLID